MVQSVLTDQPTDRPLGQSSSERFYEAMRFHLAFLFQQFVVWFDLAWLGYCRRCRILSINTSIKFQSNSQGIPTRSAYILSSKITCRHLQALSVSQSVRPCGPSSALASSQPLKPLKTKHIKSNSHGPHLHHCQHHRHHLSLVEYLHLIYCSSCTSNRQPCGDGYTLLESSRSKFIYECIQT